MRYLVLVSTLIIIGCTSPSEYSTYCQRVASEAVDACVTAWGDLEHEADVANCRDKFECYWLCLSASDLADCTIPLVALDSCLSQ